MQDEIEMAAAEVVLSELWSACKQPEEIASACLASTSTADQLVYCLEGYLATNDQIMIEGSPEAQQRLFDYYLILARQAARRQMLRAGIRLTKSCRVESLLPGIVQAVPL